jgi:hypothetical protein
MFAHIDADAFFASVLQRDQPRLRGKSVLALGMSGGTAVIAASYEAKRMGVRTGMRTSEAKKLAPGAIALPADFAATSLASDQLFQLLERWCPGGWIWRYQVPSKRYLVPFRSFLGLPVSIGIAATKTLAKMASKRNKPRGVCVVLEKNREAFLSALPINAIPGIGPRLSSRLSAYRSSLTAHRTEPDPPKSISRCRSFLPSRDNNFLFSQLLTHLSYCVCKLRREELECSRVSVWLGTRYPRKRYLVPLRRRRIPDHPVREGIF